MEVARAFHKATNSFCLGGWGVNFHQWNSLIFSYFLGLLFDFVPIQFDESYFVSFEIILVCSCVWMLWC
jgi:hypothetical protein